LRSADSSVVRVMRSTFPARANSLPPPMIPSFRGVTESGMRPLSFSLSAAAFRSAASMVPS